MEKVIRTIEKLFNKEEVIIAALGDSLTYGWMTERGFLDFLDDMLKKKYPGSPFKILNRGIPGDTARDGLRRLDREILRFNPDLVLIQFALNDAYTEFNPDNFKKNIDMIISKVREKTGSEIALLTSVALLDPLENKTAETFYSRIRELGTKHTIPVAAVHDYWKKKISEGVIHSTLVQMDGVHPTEKGYQLMAEAVFELF
jgi:lysophospholipase L1-like esterase